MAGTQMQLEDWLDDLCVRFIINLPEEDLSSVARICFQVEEAQWFYEDFIRPLDPNLPSMTLRTFCLRIFQHCPLLASFSTENHIQAFEEFLQYKTRVPVRGAILLNPEMDSTVLVKGWKKGANWSFPRGKINKDEDDLDCAVREVWEETGLDLRAAGLVPTEGKPKYIEITMREQQMRLYVFRDVPMDTIFRPQTRKEISKIQWYRLSELPAFRKKGVQNGQDPGAAGPSANKFYMVAPFLVPLKKWVGTQKRLDAKRAPLTADNTHLNPHYSLDEAHTEDDIWPQPEPERSAHGINTLEGATHELQRLLKVQPPTQGLQFAPAAEDKASALLSMLQAKDPNLPPPPPQTNPMPHTPLGATDEAIPQPRNPHHHTNQQHQGHIHSTQPPPPFPTNLFQQGQQWNATPNQYHHHPPHNFQSSLVHPQPLPPQVQRTVFDKGAFQENQAPMQNRAPPHVQQEQPYIVSRQPSMDIPLPTGKPVQLDGQSMTLLNVFKQADQGAAPIPQSGDSRTSAEHATHLDYGQRPPLPMSQAIYPPSELAAPSSSSQQPAKAQLPTESHRSALLGMFKNELSETSAAAPEPKPRDTGTQMEKQLLNTLRGGSTLSASPATQTATNQLRSGTTDTSAALSDFLALRPKPEQGAPQQAISNENVPIAPFRSGPQGHAHTPSQPIRILQRGQPADSPLALPAQLDRGLRSSPYSNQALPGTVELATSADRSSVHSPGSVGRRPEPSQEQKSQLLSLFGKQQKPPMATPDAVQAELAAHEPPTRSRLVSLASASGELSFSAGPPSRGSTQTPMSPADQSFLLDYLQSVTNNASR